MIRKYGWIALTVLLADQAVKQLARTLNGSLVMIPGVLAFTYAENTGMAFSLLSGQSWLLGVVSAAVILIGYLVLRRYRLGTLASVAAMLMLGGAAGNMIDRFAYGYVVDMFEVTFMRFAIFNVADIFVCCGAALVVISVLFEEAKKHG